MSIEVWLSFVIACAVLTLIPGPCVLLVISQSLTKGIRAALMCILGDVIGGIILMVLSLVGVGAILATSATLFMIFKWLGVGYMAYLGYCQIKDARAYTANNNPTDDQAQNIDSMKAGFIASSLNPKAIAFYMAFLPQFMTPGSDQVLQFAILIVTSSVVVAVILAGYALVAASASRFFQHQKSEKYLGYVGGSFLISGSAYMATAVK
ncbi:Lysine exporter protein (LYSE/YGGA) [Shewanella piezotolerans WP3]|uniref:Lysine exporter protein (LYSE/YGGA) n=1 Tax=Shewanella piezotolerans (strain WP3 / JCM 13877) TaxID=225849 RepID=B8CHQ1_SHEPW|nr:LysE family translocator [Shewanella piezotolerans]ACJ27177.1 Lysine exporter protein (LYSE/YGGA) [Shewanella piezotolerans WP3]